ncbi:hypothetical protein GCM10009664_59280 [Kitasatospora gansuensis]
MGRMTEITFPWARRLLLMAVLVGARYVAVDGDPAGRQVVKLSMARTYYYEGPRRYLMD